MWELDHKESWVLKNWCFWTVVLEKTVESPWAARRINQSILKEVSPEYSLEGLMLKLKLQYFGHLMWKADSAKKPNAGKDWGQEEDETEDEMVGWHHWLDGHELEWAPGDSGGQRRLAAAHGVTESQTRLSNWTAARSFPISQLFPSGDQNIRASASASVLPMNILDWFPLGRTGWVSLLSRGLSGVFSSTSFLLHPIALSLGYAEYF